MLERGKVGEEDRGRHRADRLRRQEPAEPRRAHPQNVLGIDRQQRYRAAEQHRKEIQGDRGEQNPGAPDVTRAFEQGLERGERNLPPRAPRAHRQQQQEEARRQDRVSEVYERRAVAEREQSTARCGTEDRGQLPGTAVPCHRALEGLSRRDFRQQGALHGTQLQHGTRAVCVLRHDRRSHRDVRSGAQHGDGDRLRAASVLAHGRTDGVPAAI